MRPQLIISYHKILFEASSFRHRPVGGASVSPELRSPSLGLGLTRRSLGRSLLTNARRVRLCLGLAAGRRRPPAPASSLQEVLTLEKVNCFYRWARPLAATTIKNLELRHTEPPRIRLENHEGEICSRGNLSNFLFF